MGVGCFGVRSGGAKIVRVVGDALAGRDAAGWLAGGEVAAREAAGLEAAILEVRDLLEGGCSPVAAGGWCG